VKKIRHAIETAIVRFGTWFLPKLPRRAILLLARVTGAVAYVCDWRGRRTAHENLRVAFVREGITAEQIRRIALASYQTFARTFLELFWSVRLTRDNYQEIMHFRFADPAVEELARRRGALLVTPHFGNFEVLSNVWGFRDFSFLVVAQEFKNPALTGIFARLRGMTGHKLIPQTGALLRLIKNLSSRGSAAMLTDLNIKPGKMAAAVRYFGLLTSVTTLHTHISKRLGLPVIVCIATPLDDDGYRVNVEAALEPDDFDSPADMARAVWEQCEKRIRETPEAWMWMYKHWRYLPTPVPDSSYPDYANYWKLFEKLVEDTEG